MSEYDTQYTKQVVCPFCGCEHEDADNIVDEEGVLYDCDKCEKRFWAYAHIEVTYITAKPNREDKREGKP